MGIISEISAEKLMSSSFQAEYFGVNGTSDSGSKNATLQRLKVGVDYGGSIAKKGATLPQIS